MTLDPELDQIIRIIRTRLCTRTPFFGSLALFAEVESSETISTAATDGRKILVNPTFFGGLSPAEQEGVFMHEVLHAALLHVPRGQGREAERWNIAADIVVNGILVQEGFTLPQNHTRDLWLERFSVEEAYELLKEPLKGPGKGPLKGSRRPGQKHQLVNPDLLMGGDPADEQSSGPMVGQAGQEREQGQRDFWNNAREQASIMAESSMYGSLPASIQRELDQLRAAQLNWRHYLWRYLVRTPIDFTGFDRRFVGQRLYLETLEGETVRVAVAVDTSGSINKVQIQAFLSEVQSILQAYPHLQCSLYYVDTVAHGPYQLTGSSPIPPPVGGGGTDFRPFFDSLTRQHDPWTTSVSVYLTDGYGRFPAAPPQDPVLWVVTAGGLNSDQFPFGEVVRLAGDPSF